jgi:FkbM family methyltransferase
MSSLKTLGRQLPLQQLVRHLPAEGARRLLNRWGATSYAQTGEDLLIASLLGWPRSGFYVDLGSHHPINRSTTYALYLCGLTGIAIDANEEFAADFAKFRPKDRFVRACVGNEGGAVDFTIYKDRALSSATRGRVAGLSDAQYAVDRVERLPIRKLNDILAEAAAPKQIDLLSIDVEGQDFSALKSVDLDTYSFRLIVVELHGVDVRHIAGHEASLHLRAFGYTPVSCHRSNVLFMRV